LRSDSSVDLSFRRLRQGLKFASGRADSGPRSLWGPQPRTLAERRTDLLKFNASYENLVETLCDGAQYGPTPKLEQAYAEARGRYLATLPSVRSYVISFLPEYDLGSFDHLVQSETLTGFLGSDDGSIITEITTTRDALSRYDAHLRLLAGRRR
jgi:hypothetical protein